MASKAETDESRYFWASTRAMESLSLSKPSSDDAGVVDIKSAVMISGRDSSFSLYASATSSDESCDLLGRALSNVTLSGHLCVVVKEDKKLLTVLFPDGRDGQAFTLKNGMFKNDQLNAGNASSDQVKDRQTAKSLVIGRPILLALEEMALHPS
ncbi:hypothetical protein C2S52_007276 [Perilla frutescens var. hirtella]|nr:hypothetical protein C2S52_007276 [Perilla frutescens var. hirtella]